MRTPHHSVSLLQIDGVKVYMHYVSQMADIKSCISPFPPHTGKKIPLVILTLNEPIPSTSCIIRFMDVNIHFAQHVCRILKGQFEDQHCVTVTSPTMLVQTAFTTITK